MSHTAIFVFNLLQDVNILRPLVYMTSLDLGLNTEIFVTHKFHQRDKQNLWEAELNGISNDCLAPVYTYSDNVEVLCLLQGKSGYLVAGSESNLSAHDPTHQLFQLAPASFLKITLQHGFECVGFLQNRQHDSAHGTSVQFAADIVCGWQESNKLRSMLSSQYPKLITTGPTCVLQGFFEKKRPRDSGIICENLHSVRLNGSVDLKTPFMQIFGEFCSRLGNASQITLRPHPGGQYVIKKKVPLSKNVILNNDPMYAVPLPDFQYGISAPSSVLIDMVLADIPTAVWLDSNRIIDATNYQGLTEVISVNDWLDFRSKAITSPEYFRLKQRKFLEQLDIPVDPEFVYQKFAGIFSSLTQRVSGDSIRQSKERIMFIANSMLATLQISFIRPLEKLKNSGEFSYDFIFEHEIKKQLKSNFSGTFAQRWIQNKLNRLNPTILVFCRYSGPYVEFMIQWARERNIPVMFHIDDDLLNIPRQLGEDKYKHHNHPDRIATILTLLSRADLVYSSTFSLRERLIKYTPESHIVSGSIYCSGSVYKEPLNEDVIRIGYMAGVVRPCDLGLVIPSIVKILHGYPKIEFHLFGSTPKPVELNEFGERIKVVSPLSNYEEFLIQFSNLNWHIGICPLENISFNLVKANTKWVEYTAMGVAVIAQKSPVYNDCCSDDCGLLADKPEDWYSHLSRLIENPLERFQLIVNAQNKMKNEYSEINLTKQVLSMFEKCKLAHQNK